MITLWRISVTHPQRSHPHQGHLPRGPIRSAAPAARSQARARRGQALDAGGDLAHALDRRALPRPRRRLLRPSPRSRAPDEAPRRRARTARASRHPGGPCCLTRTGFPISRGARRPSRSAWRFGENGRASTAVRRDLNSARRPGAVPNGDLAHPFHTFSRVGYLDLSLPTQLDRTCDWDRSAPQRRRGCEPAHRGGPGLFNLPSP
jgi:hypothetical protein